MTLIHSDPVMQALAYPFEQGRAVFPDSGPILLGNAIPQPGPWTGDRSTVWQWWKSYASAFEKAGFQVISQDLNKNQKFSITLLRLPRQREEAQYLMASAWAALEKGGLFMAAASNNAGGSRLEKDLSPYFPDLQATAKYKCRIVWCHKAQQELPSEWMSAGTMRKDPGTGRWTQPGLFSWDRLDPATAMLLPLIPSGLKGRVADLGCGTGVIADHLLKYNPDIAAMICIDADARALEACRKTVTESHPNRVVEYCWIDLSQPVNIASVDTVIMNPPFHAEKIQAITLGQSFIKNAATMLKAGGSLWVVANAHLPYEPTLREHFKTVEKCHEAHGFKVIHAVV